MLDFGFASVEEVSQELGARLRAQRLAQGLSQEDLAGQAGISPGTVHNLEKKGQASLESLVRLSLALGLADDLAKLFQLKVTSIAQMEKAEGALRQRAPRKQSRP